MKWMCGFLSVVFLLAAVAQGGQYVQQGGYSYWEDGQNQSFPINNNGMWYHKLQGATAYEWTFYHPVRIEPSTGEVVYFIYWTDGQRIATRYSTDQAWTETGNCDLGQVKAYRDQKYNEMIAQVGSDFRAYYAATHFEADRIYHACRAIVSRQN